MGQLMSLQVGLGGTPELSGPSRGLLICNWGGEDPSPAGVQRADMFN